MTEQQQPPAAERLPNEAYYQQPPAQQPREPYYQQPPVPQPQPAERRRRWGQLLLIVGIVWLVVTFAGSGGGLLGSLFSDERTVARVERADALVLSLVSEDVEIVPSDDGQIHLDALLRGNDVDEGSPEQALERAGVRIRNDGGTLRLEARPAPGFSFFGFGNASDVELRLAVPPDMPINMEGLSGNIEVRGVKGDINITTTSGDINLNDVAGALVVDTKSGNLEVSDAQLTSLTANTASGDVSVSGVRDNVRVTTLSGNVELREVQAAALELQTTSGDIEFDGGLSADQPSRIKSISGNVDIQLAPDTRFRFSNSTVSGEVDLQLEDGAQDSGPELRVETTSGDIEVRQ